MAKKIMIVDDEPDIRITLKAILEKAGYAVVEAVNGDDCLKKVQGGEKPDLILLDIMMPGTPVREIIPKLKGLKIAYLSVVRTSEAEKENLMKSAARHYVHIILLRDALFYLFGVMIMLFTLIK